MYWMVMFKPGILGWSESGRVDNPPYSTITSSSVCRSHIPMDGKINQGLSPVQDPTDAVRQAAAAVHSQVASCLLVDGAFLQAWVWSVWKKNKCRLGRKLGSRMLYVASLLEMTDAPFAHGLWWPCSIAFPPTLPIPNSATAWDLCGNHRDVLWKESSCLVTKIWGGGGDPLCHWKLCLNPWVRL